MKINQEMLARQIYIAKKRRKRELNIFIFF